MVAPDGQCDASPQFADSSWATPASIPSGRVTTSGTENGKRRDLPFGHVNNPSQRRCANGILKRRFRI